MSFRFKLADGPTPRYACVQFYNRCNAASSSRPTPLSRVRRHSVVTASGRRSSSRHPVLSPSPARSCGTTRFKTGIAANAQKASFWSMRGYPFWHRPGCTWVHSDGDPRQTPRDKDCPACQEEDKRPTELSNRELVWQRQLQLMREWIQRDPYDTLFGRSNDRLKGVLRRGMLWDRKLLRHHALSDLSKHDPWDKWLGWNEPSWRRGLFQDTEKTDAAQEKSTPKAPSVKSPASDERPDGTKSESALGATKDDAPSTSTSSIPHMCAYSRWKVSSTDASGKISEQSGEMIYDPITMRMIPTQSTNESAKKNDEPIAGPPKSSKDTQEIPVKKFEAASANQVNEFSAPPKAKRESIDDMSSNLASESVSSADSAVPKTTIGMTEPNSEQSTSTPLGLTIAERRLHLIRRAERAMTLAQSQLEVLSVVLDRAQSRSLKSAELSGSIKSLQRVQSAMKGLIKDPPADEAAETYNLKPTSKRNYVRSPEKLPQEEPVPVKEALESSWARETANRQRQANEPLKTPTSTSVVASSSLPGKPAAEDMKSLAQKRINPLLQRDRALKHMNSYEIQMHRAALLKKCAKKHKETPALTPADVILNKEIHAQKAAMAAFESKWNKRSPNDSRQPVKTSPKTSMEDQLKVSTLNHKDVSASHSQTSNSKVAAALSGQQDSYPIMDPEMYKMVQAKLRKDAESSQDRKLVADVKQIYEEAYGTINEHHRQGHIIHRETEKSTNNQPNPSTRYGISPTAQPEPHINKEAKASPKSEQQFSIRTDKTALYQVLAYDRATDSVHVASASASFSPPTGNRTLSFSDALERLHQPAKFLPFISKLHSDGYQIVSANKNLLVFRNISAEEALPVSAEGSAPMFTTPRKQVQLDKLPANGPLAPANSLKAPKPSSVPSPQNPRVRKEEPVFTGRPLNDSSSNSSAGPSNAPREERITWWIAQLIDFVMVAFIAAVVLYVVPVPGDPTWRQKSKDQKELEADLASNASPVSAEVPIVATENGMLSEHSDNEEELATGLWAAVRREQNERAEAQRMEYIMEAEAKREQAATEAKRMEAIMEAETKREQAAMEAEQQHRIVESSKSATSLGQVTNAAVDVALFSAVLWVVTKFLE